MCPPLLGMTQESAFCPSTSLIRMRSLGVEQVRMVVVRMVAAVGVVVRTLRNTDTKAGAD
jgi:hypothetical protein